jgi:hypothetical protein
VKLTNVESFTLIAIIKAPLIACEPIESITFPLISICEKEKKGRIIIFYSNKMIFYVPLIS